MSDYLQVDVPSRSMLRVSTNDPPGGQVRIAIYRKSAGAVAWTEAVPAISGSVDLRDPDLETEYRIAGWIRMIFMGDVPLNVVASQVTGANHWLLTFGWRGSVFAMVRVEVIVIDDDGWPPRAPLSADLSWPQPTDDPVPADFGDRQIGLDLENVAEERHEGVVVKSAGNTWSSPAGGWLTAQAGVWNQLPDGLHLMDAAGKTEVAFCSGLIFVSCNEGDRNQAIYNSSGGAGFYTVVATPLDVHVAL